MKKLIVGIALIVLLVGILAACSQNEEYKEEAPHENGDSVTSDVADFLTLDAEFRALRDEPERTVTVEEIFDLQAVNGAVLHTSITQILADGINESIATWRVRDGGGAVIAEEEFIFTGGSGYEDIEFYLSHLISEMFDMVTRYAEMFGVAGVVFEDISTADVLGAAYTHLQLSNDETAEWMEKLYAWRKMHTGIYDLFTEKALGNYLSRNDEGVFRIEIIGKAMATYIEAVLKEIDLDDGPMLRELVMIAEIDDALRSELEHNFSHWIRSSDLTEAALVIERWKSGDYTYHQNIELYVPGQILIRDEFTVVVGESAVITAPALFLTEDELERHTEGAIDWMVDFLDFLIEAMP